jgi:hypothetical protein
MALTRQQYEAEYEMMASALKDICKMFDELDKYRRTKDQKKLWLTHDFEWSARRKIKALIKMQKEHDAINQSTKNAS